MTYLEQVKAALWGEKAVWPVEQTDRLLALHAQQGTGALVFPAVLTQDDIPVAAKMQMKAMCMSTMQQHVKLQHTLEQAWRALTEAGIHAVLMKGAGLAALYPEPQMRPWGDIDLFVGKDQYHPACAVMRNTFPDALKFDEELDHYKHYNLIADGISIEVHRVSVGLQHPIDAQRYARMEEQGMTRAEELTINGLTVRVPEPTFNALFVCMHSWEHMTTQGANIRQLCDLALLLHTYAKRIDEAQLKRNLQALHLMDVWQVYMWILTERLGLPKNEAFFYTDAVAERASRLLNDLLNNRLCAANSQSNTSKNRFVRKIHTMQERLRNARRIAQYSPAYARHMKAETLLHGAMRLFAKDRHWE